VYEQLAQLSSPELRADGGGEGHEIPCSPVTRVLRRLGDEWVTLEQYAERVEGGERAATGAGDMIRIELAHCVRASRQTPRRTPAGRSSAARPA
jgi:hypothetical protein